MRENKWIWFDLDGTVADLYSVDNWLNDLLAYNTRPYEVAKIMYNNYALVKLLAELKYKGYKLGVISWSSKAHNEAYDRAVTIAKKKWLKDKMLDILLDEIIVTPYGVCKADTCRKFGRGILIDDEEQNREAWDLGDTIDATGNILKELYKLL